MPRGFGFSDLVNSLMLPTVRLPLTRMLISPFVLGQRLAFYVFKGVTIQKDKKHEIRTAEQAFRQVHLLKQADFQILRFGYVGLARDPNLPKFETQGEKSGDFLSGFLKKYYSNLVFQIAHIQI
ncbi:hypothetical protein CCZ20_28380 [Priestia aryabhattai]|uniref:hypothetical protein n=1 Tax=Priestia TaxID=2800373 RepID=UPI000B513AA4|nr:MULTISPECIES: hypothetical protein [Priestia]OVE34088.1 hypothetical protein CCZ20_28380 [Priestia aryabhattai]